MDATCKLLRRLERPHACVDAVLDTDAYNEVDDQFAIAYLLRAGDRTRAKALYAAPFYASFNPNSTDPEDGMLKSYDEIRKVVSLAGQEEMLPQVFHGSRRFLPDEKTPVDSPAARDLAVRAMAYTEDAPLYVLSIGAITNVASALLMNPAIRDRVVIVWLGGHAFHWPDTFAFNMFQDIAAARVVMDSGAAVVHLPCMGVTDALKTTQPELRAWLQGRNALCDYLCENTIAEAERNAPGKPWSRVIWDVSAVAWLVDWEGRMVQDTLVPAPIPEYDYHYSHSFRRHPIRQAWSIDRDAVFDDLFTRLRQEG